MVQIEGTMANEFEGPLVGSVTSWMPVGLCGIVPDEPVSWGGLKARYR